MNAFIGVKKYVRHRRTTSRHSPPPPPPLLTLLAVVIAVAPCSGSRALVFVLVLILTAKHASSTHQVVVPAFVPCGG